MRTQRPTPIRGLFAGLLALIAFASFVVAITAGGSSQYTRSVTQTLPARTAVGEVDSEARGAGRFRGDDADGHDERSPALDGDRR